MDGNKKIAIRKRGGRCREERRDETRHGIRHVGNKGGQETTRDRKK